MSEHSGEDSKNRSKDEQYDSSMHDMREGSPHRGSGEEGNMKGDNDGSTLYISNLASSITTKTLRELFDGDGDVMDCQIVFNPITRESRGFGFVRFATNDQARVAVERHNSELVHGRKMTLALAKRKHPHEPTPGYYKGPVTTQMKYDSHRNYHSGDWHRGQGSYHRDSYPPRRRDYEDRFSRADRDRGDRYESRYGKYESRYEEKHSNREDKFTSRYASPYPIAKGDGYGRRYDRERRHSREQGSTVHRIHPETVYERRRSPDNYSRNGDYRRSSPRSRDLMHNDRNRRNYSDWRRTPSPRHRR